MNFDELNSSQDFEAFISFQVPIDTYLTKKVPTDNLQDVAMSEMEQLVDYESSKKDDLRWTNGSGEGNLQADESGSISDNLTVSLAATTEVDDQGVEGVLVEGEYSGFVDIAMFEDSNPPETKETWDETVSEISGPSIEFAGNAPVVLSDPLIEERDDTKITEGKSLFRRRRWWM